MCVIAAIEKVRLSEDQVRAMWEANKFGGGVAWRAKSDITNLDVVKWKKGLDLDDMIKLNNELPMPYVLHFRVPSNDTSHSSLACHPFAINDDASFDWEGETSGSVLFHNGFWADWRNKIQNIAINGFVLIPSGPWSDSRGLAWAANHLGLGFLEMVNEKAVVLGAGEGDLELFGSWNAIKNPDSSGSEHEVLVSNKGWERNLPAVITKPADRGAATTSTFRTSNFRVNTPVAIGPDQQEQIQEGTKETQSGLTLFCSETTCRKGTNAGQMIGNVFYCIQCWAKRAKEINRGLYGLCVKCKVNNAGAKLTKINDWICMPCWEVNGKPDVYFELGGKPEGFYD